MRYVSVVALLFLGWATASAADDAILYAGLAGAKILDSGAIVVTGGGAFDRTETFEYVKRPQGGVTLLNVITAADGAYRVAARFDLDDQWQSERAIGAGLYNGKPVHITMQKAAAQVEIAVTDAGKTTNAIAACAPSCFINMSPSITAMFVMTRHYDMARGGLQVFQWAGQDLDRVRTLSGGKARLMFDRDQTFTRRNGEQLTLRHFTFVEELPAADGATFKLDFDLWADADHRPFGFRVRPSNNRSSRLIGFRQGFEDVRDLILAQATAPTSAAGN